MRFNKRKTVAVIVISPDQSLMDLCQLLLLSTIWFCKRGTEMTEKNKENKCTECESVTEEERNRILRIKGRGI